MSRAHSIFVLSFVLCACGQQPATEPVAPAPAAEPAAPTPAPAPTPEPPVAPVEPAAAPSAEPVADDKPVGTSSTMTGESTAKRPVKPAEPSHAAAPVAAPAPAPAPVAQAAAAGPCGEEGQPQCPLQAFMEHNVQQPMEAGDLAAVAKGLTRAAKLAPDASWNAGPTGWSTIAEGGADAAAAGDGAAAKASCKSCHKAFRAKYKASFRTKPL